MGAVVRVLLVEDDASLTRAVEVMLKKEDVSVEATDSGEDGIELAKLYDFDLILLDLMLPDIDGHEIIRRLRGIKIKTPILVMSGLGQVEQRLKALDAGADDFLTKPFDRRELLSRIKAIVRRSRGQSAASIDMGRMVLFTERKEAEIDGHNMRLSPKEYEILELLVLKRGATVTKEMFLNNIYGGLDEPEAKIIDVFVCKLRKKLDWALGNKEHIETVWGRGYVLRDPVAEGLAAERMALRA